MYIETRNLQNIIMNEENSNEPIANHRIDVLRLMAIGQIHAIGAFRVPPQRRVVLIAVARAVLVNRQRAYVVGWTGATVRKQPYLYKRAIAGHDSTVTILANNESMVCYHRYLSSE